MNRMLGVLVTLAVGLAVMWVGTGTSSATMPGPLASSASVVLTEQGGTGDGTDCGSATAADMSHGTSCPTSSLPGGYLGSLLGRGSGGSGSTAGASTTHNTGATSGGAATAPSGMSASGGSTQTSTPPSGGTGGATSTGSTGSVVNALLAAIVTFIQAVLAAVGL